MPGGHRDAPPMHHVSSLGEAAALLLACAARWEGRPVDAARAARLRAGAAPRDAVTIIQLMYRLGCCGEFAVALHQLTGWEVYQAVDWKGPVHACCQRPDGVFVDVCGETTAEALRAREGYRPIRMGPAPDLRRLIGRPAPARSPMIQAGLDPIRLAQCCAQLLPYAPFTTLAPADPTSWDVTWRGEIPRRRLTR